MKRKLLGRYIVADPEICHGKPTFRGTRIMVWQVLEQVANGMSWEAIVEEWRGSIFIISALDGKRSETLRSTFQEAFRFVCLTELFFIN